VARVRVLVKDAVDALDDRHLDVLAPAELEGALGGLHAFSDHRHLAQDLRQLLAELISNDQVRVRELPPALQQMLLALSLGQATAPFGSPERISVLVLCGRDDPEVVGGPNPDQIARRMEEERVNRRAQRYLRDLRRDAVIDYR